MVYCEHGLTFQKQTFRPYTFSVFNQKNHTLWMNVMSSDLIGPSWKLKRYNVILSAKTNIWKKMSFFQTDWPTISVKFLCTWEILVKTYLGWSLSWYKLLRRTFVVDVTKPMTMFFTIHCHSQNDQIVWEALIWGHIGWICVLKTAQKNHVNIGICLHCLFAMEYFMILVIYVWAYLLELLLLFACFF